MAGGRVQQWTLAWAKPCGLLQHCGHTLTRLTPGVKTYTTFASCDP